MPAPMRALLVCAALAPAGAFSTFNEETETRGFVPKRRAPQWWLDRPENQWRATGGDAPQPSEPAQKSCWDGKKWDHKACVAYVEVAKNAYCENRDRGRQFDSQYIQSVQACAEFAHADKMCGNGFSYGNGHCDCSPVGEPCVAKGWAGYTVFGFKQHVDTPTYVKVMESAYCFNRVFPGKSRYAESVTACAAAVSADPECGNGFSFYGGVNSDRNLKYCDCPPPGEPCVAGPINTGAAPNIYTVYGFVHERVLPHEEPSEYRDTFSAEGLHIGG